MSQLTENYIIAVMARDRPGIIATITHSVFAMGGNVIELSQTVMRGYFSLILCATLPAETQPETIRKGIEKTGKEMGLSASVCRFDPQSLFTPEKNTGIWFLTLQGQDRPGLIYQVTSHLADLEINIEDLYTRSEGKAITMILQIHPASPHSAE